MCFPREWFQRAQMKDWKGVRPWEVGLETRSHRHYKDECMRRWTCQGWGELTFGQWMPKNGGDLRFAAEIWPYRSALLYHYCIIVILTPLAFFKRMGNTQPLLKKMNFTLVQADNEANCFIRPSAYFGNACWT